MSKDDYRAGRKQGYLEGLKAAVDTCEATCGKWHKIGKKEFSGESILVCPCAEAIKKLERLDQ